MACRYSTFRHRPEGRRPTFGLVSRPDRQHSAPANIVQSGGCGYSRSTAFTGEGKLVLNATGYGSKNLKPSFPPPLGPIGDPTNFSDEADFSAYNQTRGKPCTASTSNSAMGATTWPEHAFRWTRSCTRST